MDAVTAVGLHQPDELQCNLHTGPVQIRRHGYKFGSASQRLCVGYQVDASRAAFRLKNQVRCISGKGPACAGSSAADSANGCYSGNGTVRHMQAGKAKKQLSQRLSQLNQPLDNPGLPWFN
jgi:hypothetical protein